MKKTVAALLSALMIFCALSALCFAADGGTPVLSLSADYDASKRRARVYYDVDNIVGLESADFRLKYQSKYATYVDSKAEKISKDVFVEIGNDEKSQFVAIQFVHMYCVTEEECPGGSARICYADFDISEDAGDTVAFTAYTDSCNVDPDSRDCYPERYTLTLDVTQSSTAEGTAVKSGSVNKVAIIACAAAACVVVIIVAVAVTVKKANAADNKNAKSAGKPKKAQPKPEKKREEPVEDKPEVEFVFDPNEDMSNYNSDKFDD